MQTTSDRPPMTSDEKKLEIASGIFRQRRQAWRKLRFGVTTAKRQSRLTDKGVRSRQRILAIAKWPRQAAVCKGGILSTVSDADFFSTYSQAKSEILEAARNNESIQVLIQAHGEYLPFPSDCLETLQVRQRSPSPGIQDDPTCGNYDGYHIDYGVPFPADEDASDEDMPERPPDIKKERAEEGTLPTGMTDDEQDFGKELRPGQLAEKLLGPLTVKEEEASVNDAENDDSNKVAGVWEDEEVFHLDNEEVSLVVDPGATATLLRVPDAQMLWSKGLLSNVTGSTKRFKVANGAAMFASTEGVLTIAGLPSARAFIIEANETQALPVSLLGSAHLSGQILDMSSENPKLGTVALRRLANGHLVMHIH